MYSNKSFFELLFVIVVASFLFIVQNSAVLADVVTVDGITIDPAAPSDLDEVEIHTWGSIGYIFDIAMVDSDFNISGTLIELDFYFLDANPTGIRLPVAGGWDSEAEAGILSLGIYDVVARVWVTEDFLIPDFRLADMCSTSFEVIPEPATSLLLVTGGIWLFRFRKRRVMNGY